MRKMMLVLALSALPFRAAFGDEDFPGTYKLVSSTLTVLETGELKESYGKQPSGYIMYGTDGRMMVMITYGGRPIPPPTAQMTDKDRSDQYRTMTAYGGTYQFDGNLVKHHIDIASNESRVGSTVIREVQREGNRLIYTTRPQPFSGDGRMSIINLIWEKVK